MLSARIFLADEAQAPQTDVKYKQGVYRNANSILHNARATQDTDASSQCPSNEHNVNRDSSNGRKTDSTEHGSDDQWEEGVADDAYRLEERAARNVSRALGSHVEETLTCCRPEV